MATLETLSDLLTESGVIDRTRLNIGRFRYLLQYLGEMREKESMRQKPETQEPVEVISS